MTSVKTETNKAKNQGKDVREPVGDGRDDGKMANVDKNRAILGASSTFDATYYVKKYPEMQLRWSDYEDGTVDKLLDCGFELVPKRESRINRPKGLGDREESQWVCKHVRSMNGAPMEVYLMMATKEVYAAVILDPVKRRNDEIQRAMGLGEIDQIAQEAGEGLKTYAANANSSEAAFNKIR